MEFFCEMIRLSGSVKDLSVWAGEHDGMTSAMRLGFAKKTLALEDILWPGCQIPRPKRSRRKGASVTI